MFRYISHARTQAQRARSCSTFFDFRFKPRGRAIQSTFTRQPGNAATVFTTSKVSSKKCDTLIVQTKILKANYLSYMILKCGLNFQIPFLGIFLPFGGCMMANAAGKDSRSSDMRFALIRRCQLPAATAVNMNLNV